MIQEAHGFRKEKADEKSQSEMNPYREKRQDRLVKGPGNRKVKSAGHFLNSPEYDPEGDEKGQQKGGKGPGSPGDRC